MQRIASKALDRCAAGESAWTRTVQEPATRISTEAGVRGAPQELREQIAVANTLALEDCFSIPRPTSPAPEHVANLTNLRVVQVETELRALITAHIPEREPEHPDMREHAAVLGQRLDVGQFDTSAAVASHDPLLIVEDATGAGKTNMLATAIHATEQQGGSVRDVTPTKHAAVHFPNSPHTPASPPAGTANCSKIRSGRRPVSILRVQETACLIREADLLIGTITHQVGWCQH